MPLPVFCPGCGRGFLLRESLQGRRVICAGCKQSFMLPNTAGPGFLPDRYEVVAELGQGAFGIVYHARDRLRRRDVAIKVLKPEVMASVDAVRRFEYEAHIMATIVHPNIMPVLEHGQHAGRSFIVFPLVRGRTLKDLIPPGGLRDQREAVALVVLVARALNHAWTQHRILHRDIKPSNIMLPGGDLRTLYLVDFGLAVSRGSGTSAGTLTGMVLGTPAYMSPEQASGQVNNIDHRSDVYSTGVVLFQALTGAVPFPGAYPEVLFDIIDQPPPVPSSLRPGLPRELDLIVLRALEKEPEDRHTCGADLAEALEHWLRAPTASRSARGLAPAALPAVQEDHSPVRRDTPVPVSARESRSGNNGSTVASPAVTGSAPPPLPPTRRVGGSYRWLLLLCILLAILAVVWWLVSGWGQPLQGGSRRDWWDR